MPNSRSNVADYVGSVLDSITKMQTRQTIAQKEQPRPQLTGLQALFGGAIRAQQKMINDRRLAEDQQREQAIALLQSIPDSETNTPVKARLLMEMMNAKPGKKGIFDQLFNPNPDTEFGEQLLAKFASVLPSQQEQRQMSDTQKPIDGKVDFGDGEGNFAVASNQILYDEEKNAYIPVLNKKTGQLERRSLDQLKGDKLKGIEAKGESGGTKSPQQKEMEARALAMAAKENQLKGRTVSKLSDLSEEEQKSYLSRAAIALGTVYQNKDAAIGIKPELMKSQVEANRVGMPSKAADVETGQTKKEMLARADEIIKQGAAVQADVVSLYSKYAQTKVRIKALEEKKTKQGILLPSEEKELSNGQAELEGLKTGLQGKADAVRSNYGEYYDVNVDSEGVPSGIIKRKEVKEGGILPRSAKPNIKPPVAKAKQFDDALSKGPGVVTPNGDSKYYVTDDVEIPQGAAMMKHNYVDDGAVIVDKTRIADLANKQLKPGKVLTFNGKAFLVVYVSPSNNRFVMKEKK